jgi:drug/metabolite transporter, DME family
MDLASVRASGGFIGIAVIMAARRRWRGQLRVGGRGLLFLAAYGVLGYALFTAVYLAAIERAGVSVAAALLYTAPAFVLLMSTVIWKERVTPLRSAALLLVLAGVALVTDVPGMLRGAGSGLPAGALLAGIAAGATYAIYTVLSKAAVGRFGAGASLFWSFLAAAAVFAVIAPPHRPFIEAPGYALHLAALGVVPTLIPYALYLTALRGLRASTAAMLASIEPVIAALLAASLLGERLASLQVAGILLVVTAAGMLTREVRTETGLTSR